MSAVLAIRFGTLHHQTGGPPLRNGVLSIEDGRITRIGSSEADVPLGAQTIEAACIVPGLVNAHVHLEMSGEAQTTTVFVLKTPTQRALICVENARKTLASGVTAVRDLGGTANLAIEVRDAIVEGRIAGPHIRAAGRAICMTGGHGAWIGREADGPWDVRKAVREQRKSGADCIKFIATGGVLTQGAVPGIEQLSEDELRAGISEAHVHGMRCAAHAIGAAGIANALRAGVDTIEHGHLVDDDGLALLVAGKAAIVPTLSAIVCILEGGAQSGMPDFVVRKATEIAEHIEANLRRARDRGVRFAGGSDAGTPLNYHDAYYREFELLQTMIGMTAEEALACVTIRAAEVLGLDRGSIAQGGAADLLVLERDPVHDRHALRDPQLVIKDGAIAYDRRRDPRLG